MAENLINNLDLPSDFSCGLPLYAEDLNKLKGAILTLMNIINNNDSSWRTDTLPINVSYDESTGKLTIGNDDYLLENPDNLSNGVQVLSGCPINNVTGLAKGTIFKCTNNGHVYIYTGNQNLKVTIDGVEYIGWFDLGEFNNNDNSEAGYLHIAYAKSLTFNNDNPPHIVKWSDFTTATNTGTFYEWYGMCTTNSIEDPTLTVSTYTGNNPPNQSNYEAINKYKWNYVKGPDANDTEYIYLLTKDKTSVPGINQESGVVKVYNNNLTNCYRTNGTTYTNRNDEFLPLVTNYNTENLYAYQLNNSNEYYWFDDPPKSADSLHPYLWWSNRKKRNGVWGNFCTPTILDSFVSPSEGSGTKGDFKSRVFTRTNDDISGATPEGGTYDNPKPNDTIYNGKTITWSDGVPQGNSNLSIWSTTCIFRGDGTKTNWSSPAREQDTNDLDIEFSPLEEKPHPLTLRSHPGTEHPSSSTWYDPSDPNFSTYGDMIWRAERKIANGEYVGYWVISRIKGEKGESVSASYLLDVSNQGAYLDDTSQQDDLNAAATNKITLKKEVDKVVQTIQSKLKIIGYRLPDEISIKIENNVIDRQYLENYEHTGNTHTISLVLNNNATTITEGKYYYEYEIYDINQPDLGAIYIRRFNINVDKDISTDGSIPYLQVVYKQLSYYWNQNKRVINESALNPYIEVRTTRSNSPLNFNYIENAANATNLLSGSYYVELGSLYSSGTGVNSTIYSSSSNRVTLNKNKILYLSQAYLITLYRYNGTELIQVDHPEEINCVTDGKDGISPEALSEGYSIDVSNPNISLDDLTINNNVLRSASQSSITVLKNGSNITNLCTFQITSVLPSISPGEESTLSNKEIYIVNDNSGIFYLAGHNLEEGDKLIPTSSNNTYYFVIDIYHSSTKIGSKRFNIIVDKDISEDGSIYSLSIKNPNLYFNSDNTLKTGNDYPLPIIVAYKYGITSENNEKIPLNFVNSLDNVSSNALYILSEFSSNNFTNNEQEYTFNGNYPYKETPYELTLYKGNKYMDGPEYIYCHKDIKIPEYEAANRGKFYYYAGEWDPDEYYCLDNDYSIPYVSYGVDSNGKPKFYMLTSLPDGACENDNCCIGGGGENTDPSEIPNDNSDYWEEFESSKSYYMAEAYFGNFAKFGSGIISGDFMISTNGYIFDSTSNWPLDGHQYNDGTKYNNKLAYTYFDSSNPDGNNITNLTSVKFAPNWWVNLKTGAMGAALNKFLVDLDSNLTITGNVTANSFNTDGKRGNRIEISGGLFNVFNSSGQIGLSIGWDTDGNPFIFLTNGKSGNELLSYKLTYQGVLDASADITNDDATSIRRLIGTNSSGTPSAVTLHTGPSLTPYYLYSASKSNVTGAYASTNPDPSNPSSSNVTWLNARKNCDGKLFTTSTISSILGSSSSYLITNGYYISSIEVTEETGNRFSRLLYLYSNGIGSTVGKVRYKASGSTWYYCDSSWDTLGVINGLNHSVQFHASDHLYDRDRSA